MSIAVIMEGSGIRNIVNKAHKGVSKGVKSVEDAAHITQARDAVREAKHVAVRKTEHTIDRAASEIKNVAEDIGKFAKHIVVDANVKNFNALKAKGVKIKKWVKANAKDMALKIGEKMTIALDGMVTTGKIMTIVGSAIIIVGELTGQPEIMTVGLVIDQAGELMELGATIAQGAVQGSMALIEGDKQAAIMAFGNAVKTGMTAYLDSVTDGTASAVLNLAQDIATGNYDQAAKDMAVSVVGFYAGEKVGVSGGVVNATTIGLNQIGNGKAKGKRYRVTPRSETLAELTIPRAKPMQTNEYKRSRIHSMPIVRGYTADYANDGSGHSTSLKDSANGLTYGFNKTYKALPEPNFETDLDTKLARSIHVHGREDHSFITDIDTEVAYSKVTTTRRLPVWNI